MRVGVDRDEQIRLVSISDLRTVLQFDEVVSVSREYDIGAPVIELPRQFHRNAEVDGPLRCAGESSCSGVVATVTGIDDDGGATETSHGRRRGKRYGAWRRWYDGGRPLEDSSLDRRFGKLLKPSLGLHATREDDDKVQGRCQPYPAGCLSQQDDPPVRRCGAAPFRGSSVTP